MLGAIKIKGEAGVSLFRSLSRRWAPVVPVKSGLPSSSHTLGLAKDDVAPPKRAWIGVPRPRLPASTVNARRKGVGGWFWTK